MSTLTRVLEAGRRLRHVDLGELPPGELPPGELPPGEQEAGFPRGMDLGAGIYWLRLAQGAGAASAKVVFVD